MKREEVILRLRSKQLTFWQAALIPQARLTVDLGGPSYADQPAASAAAAERLSLHGL